MRTKAVTLAYSGERPRNRRQLAQRSCGRVTSGDSALAQNLWPAALNHVGAARADVTSVTGDEGYYITITQYFRSSCYVQRCYPRGKRRLWACAFALKLFPSREF